MLSNQKPSYKYLKSHPVDNLAALIIINKDSPCRQFRLEVNLHRAQSHPVDNCAGQYGDWYISAPNITLLLLLFDFHIAIINCIIVWF